MERRRKIKDLMNPVKNGIHFVYMEEGVIVKEEFMLNGKYVDEDTFRKNGETSGGSVIDWVENKTYKDGKKKGN